ncbi:MAG: septal ring lytic transglycosylase RlpA family protein [Minicystis sp.]
MIRAASAALLGAFAATLAGCAGSADEAFRPADPYGQAHAPPPAGWSPSAGNPPPYQWGRASFYADRLSGRATATGEPYNPGDFTAAHRTLPLGTFVDVARTDGRHVVVRINDRGPYARGRVIDLSRRAATEIGMVREGVVDVVLRVLWVPPAKPKRL